MHKVVIIGGGPAGLSAAIYTARAMLDPVVIAPSGGQLVLTQEVGNYPGFPEDVPGPKLIGDMKKQAERFGTKFVDLSVEAVDFSSDTFKLKLSDDSEVEAQSIILATGASAKWIGVAGESRLRGKGVSACATCDGFFFRDKDVLIIGGGDTAIEDAIFLTRFANKVYVAHRRDELRASKYLQERAFENDKIEFFWNTEVKEFKGENVLEAVKLFNNKTEEDLELKVQGAFVAIGHKPNTMFLGDALELEGGYIKVEDNVYTSVDGVFAAGDVADPTYRQAAVAAGSGVMAAIAAERWLGERS